ncbi:MAG: sortase domain-bontaining protein [Streptosporangiaceae bacterium]
MADGGGPVTALPAPSGPAAVRKPAGPFTAGTEPAAARPPAPAPAASPASARSAQADQERPVFQAAGLGMLLVAVLALGFLGYLYGLSGVQEARSQAVLYAQLRNQLASQVAPLEQPGTVPAPVNPITPGTPVAILSIPAIGIRGMVVVDGTSAADLTRGPGLLPGTVLPGQLGVSAIYGRRATFGAPFARLGQLRLGDLIKVTTGQGTATYKVAAFGNSGTVIHDPIPSRLALLTASSPVVPQYYIDVDAHLVSAPQQYSGAAPVVPAADLPLTGDSQALWPAAAWSLALLLVSAGGTVAAARWSPWPAYLAAIPLALAVLWNLYGNLAMLLPNVF